MFSKTKKVVAKVVAAVLAAAALVIFVPGIFTNTGAATTSLGDRWMSSPGGPGTNSGSGTWDVATYNMSSGTSVTMAILETMSVYYWTSPAGSVHQSSASYSLVFADGSSMGFSNGQTLNISSKSVSARTSVKVRVSLTWNISTVTNSAFSGSGVRATLTIPDYTVTFKDWDGTVLKTQTVTYNGSATPPSNPSRTGYTFAGWSGSYTNVAANQTITATYNINSYNVTFKDYDGTTLKTQVVNYGSAATPPADPSRTGYSFAGWSGTYTNVTSAQTVTATYNINAYTVRFLDWDGTVLKTQSVNYGAAATAPANPSRTGYTFAGWDKSFTSIGAADLDVTATYSINSYTVRFLDWDGTVLKTESVNYGAAATAPDDPTRVDYTFAGWDKAFNSIGAANLDVTAKYDINVTFREYDSAVIETQAVTPGGSAIAPTPMDRTPIYVFTGWDTDFTNVTVPLVVTAQYKLNAFPVVFYNWDGTELWKETVIYGEAPEPMVTPTKEGYHFTGWDEDYSYITGPLNVTALFDINVYDVVYKDWDGRVINSEQVEHWGSATIVPDDPARTGYAFTGWSFNGEDGATLDNVIGNIELVAQYTINSYNVRFLNWDGSLLKEQAVFYMNNATPPANPSRDYHYFTGWDKSYKNIADETVVTATFTPYTYEVQFVDWDWSELKTETVEHGKAATAPDDPERIGYVFTGWNKSFDNVTSDMTISATYTKAVYTVKFLDWDGTELKTQEVFYNEAAAAPENPSRYGYQFAGWDVTFGAVTANTTVTALYDINVYTVAFIDWDGAELKTQQVEHGSPATAPEDPEKTGYTFAGWDEDFTAVVGDMEITAQYDINYYTVRFFAEGTELDSQRVAYNTAATPPSAPDKTGYTFAGWDTDFSHITQDTDITAVYGINSYKVDFVDWDGTLIQTSMVEYLNAAAPPANPSRPYHDFVGWDKEFNSITEPITVTAQYEIFVYEVSFKDWDGSLIETIYVEHGNSAVPPADPSREGYGFTGWSRGMENITGDTVITAQYLINTYPVTFYDYDGALLKTEMVPHGGAATAPESPEREGYTFIGWDQALDNVTAARTLNALYEINIYTVRFVDWDGTELKSEQVVFGYGAIAPPDPSRMDYRFVGWDANYTYISDDITVTAQYVLLDYFAVKFVDYDGSVISLQEVQEFSFAVAPADPEREGYTFTGWSTAFDYITSDLVVTAQYSINSYLVTFYSWDGEILSEQYVEYGSDAIPPEVPEREGYTFTGWGSSTEDIHGSAMITAQYQINTYTVTFLDWDGTELKSELVEYLGNLEAPADPAREGYTFTGWDGVAENVKENTVINALYTINVYTVRFLDWDNIELKVERVEYLGTATPPANPSRDSYTFDGWEGDYANITGDVNITAKYSLIPVEEPPVVETPPEEPPVIEAPPEDIELPPVVENPVMPEPVVPAPGPPPVVVPSPQQSHPLRLRK